MKDLHQLVTSIVIPAYNEEKTIGEIISNTILTMQSFEMPYEIIVVDDGSKDNTRRVASRYKTTVLFNEDNCGKGYALRKGFEFARGDIIVTIDSDGAHKPKEIPDLVYPLLNGADIVAGSRFLGNGVNRSTSRLNRIGNKLFNLMIMILTRKRITDSQTGFRAFKKKVLNKFCLQSVGYEIETELTVKGLNNGFVYEEKPIKSEKRKHNSSGIKVIPDSLSILKTIFKAKFS